MKEKIEKQIQEALKNLGINKEINFSVEHPEDFKNGDYSTNVAMVCAKKLGVNPKELAEKIVVEISKHPLRLSDTSPLAKGEDGGGDNSSMTREGLGGFISEIKIAVPGFINFYLSREFFVKSIDEIIEKEENWGKNSNLVGKKIMVEYTDPNPFKPFHIGHLMTNAIGESISRIVEFSGAKTIRANYQGDVGPHVAKAIYSILHSQKYLKVGLPNIGSPTSYNEEAKWIGQCYSEGSNLYDTDEKAKKEIEIINKKIYDKSDEEINKIYNWGKEITLEAFEQIYKLLGTKFDHYFFESVMAPIGEKIVRENYREVKSDNDSYEKVSKEGIFRLSQGAIVFDGEMYDKKLHTRVFINSQGLPTYETKEIGLTMTKFEKENPDLSIVITATEQAEYMKVVQKAISLMHPDLEKRMVHITHGMMRLASGKMSSRKGNVVTGESLLRDSMDIVYEKMAERDFNDEEKKKISKIVGISALKYSILRSSLGSDIVYDFEKSISFDGDSGPYLQYTAVRAKAILEKAKEFKIATSNLQLATSVEITNLEKSLYQFPEVVEKSYKNLEPHHLATYLAKLASEFNAFYNSTPILKEGNENIAYQLDIVQAFYQTMKNGLWLLGIEVPEKM